MYRNFSLLAWLSALALATVVLGGFVVAPLEEFGKAGYYSDSLHGRKTASGEKYDKNELTCAHKTLPFGTKVRVTRIDNDKSVVVRVNDRGPYAQGYIVDISRRAAEQIGLIKDGVTRVKVEVVNEAATAKGDQPSALANAAATITEEKAAKPAAAAAGTPTVLLKRHQGTETAAKSAATTPVTYSATSDAPARTTAKGGEKARAESVQSPAAAARASELYQVNAARTPKRGFGVQVMTLNDAGNLLDEVARVNKLYPNRVMVNMETGTETAERPVYKIMLGPFETRATAEVRQREAARKGFKGAFVVDLLDLEGPR